MPSDNTNDDWAARSASDEAVAANDSDDLEKAVEHLTRGADAFTDDPSRSSVHTGSRFNGEPSATTEASAPKGTVAPPLSEQVQSDDEPLAALHLDSNSLSAGDAGAIVGTLTVIDPDAGDSHSFAVSDDRFEVVEGTLRLKPGVALDREEAATIEVEVTVTDADGLALTETLMVQVADVNEAPDALHLDSNSLSEGDAGAIVGTLTVIDPDAGDSHSFAVSDDRFEVVEGTLRLKPDVALDREEAATIEVEVTVTDAGGLTLTETLMVQVADVNEAPDALHLDSNSLSEGDAGAIVGTLTVIDPDAGDSHSFAVSDDRFEVVEGTLRLKPDVALDREEAATIEVEVTVTDAGGLTLTETLMVHVTPSLDVQVESGFHARYFDMDERLTRLDDVNWDGAPTFAEVTHEIDYTNGRGSFWDGGDTDTFAAEITGTIEVTEAGEFDFFLSADDGAHLYINGMPVIDNDGLHGFLTRSGEIELEPGLHHIEVRYFENAGHAGLRLEWDGPGTNGRSLVEPPTDGEIHTIGGMPSPLQFSFENGAPPEGVSMILEGLPEGSQVDAGGEMSMVDGSGSVDVTGWDMSALTVRPPVEFNGTIDAGLLLSLPGGETGGGAENRLPFSIEVSEAQAPEPMAELSTGFQVSYFDVDHSLRTIDDIAWDSDPTHAEMINEINYTNSSNSFWEGGSRDTFGVKVEGEISVDEGGIYTFFAGGDDGVVVFVDGKPVVDNDGLHGFRTRSGEIELPPGTYEIEVRYFENYGHAGLKIEWEGPDTDGKELLQASPELDIEPNGTFDVGMRIVGDNGDAQIEIIGLPPGTIITSGDQAQIVEEGPVDVTDWNVQSMEISPPPDFEGQIDGSVIISNTAFNGAEVTGESPFTMTVGDPDASPDTLPLAMLMPSSGTGNGERDWIDADGVDATEAYSDVMEETVAEFGTGDISQISLDLYERPDL